MVPPNSRSRRPACVLLPDQDWSRVRVERVNSCAVRRSNRAIAASVSVVSCAGRAREQLRGETLEQGDRGIGQRRLELRHLCGERRDPAPLAEVVEQRQRRNRPFVCELREPGRMDGLTEVARQGQRARIRQSLQQTLHARRTGRMRQCPQPCQPRTSEARVVLEQLHQRLFVLRIESIVDRLRRYTPCSGTSGQADALQGIGARQNQTLRPHLTRQSLQDGEPVVGVECAISGEEDRRAQMLGGHEGS